MKLFEKTIAMPIIIKPLKLGFQLVSRPIRDKFPLLTSHRDFAWKVQRRIRYDRNPKLITFADKYMVKELAAKWGISTAKLLYATKNPETISFDKLPENYFIKANHASSWNISCFNSRLFLFGNGSTLIDDDGRFIGTKERIELSRDRCIKICREWMSAKYSRHEWAYHQIDPYIIVEEALETENPADFLDYRFYVFDGVVQCINVGSPRYRKKRQNVFFDRYWQTIPLTRYREALPDPIPAKPFQLAQMIQTAQILAKNTDFLRVDLYLVQETIVFGEITIYPEAGLPDSPTSCPVFNKWLASLWKQNY